jgi:hypothetical protein
MTLGCRREKKARVETRAFGELALALPEAILQWQFFLSSTPVSTLAAAVKVRS